MATSDENITGTEKQICVKNQLIKNNVAFPFFWHPKPRIIPFRTPAAAPTENTVPFVRDKISAAS